MINKTIEIESVEELDPLLKSISYGVIHQFIFLKPSEKELNLAIYTVGGKLCINVSDISKAFEIELRVTFHSQLEHLERRISIC